MLGLGSGRGFEPQARVRARVRPGNSDTGLRVVGLNTRVKTSVRVGSNDVGHEGRTH